MTKEQAEQGAVSLPALHERVKTDMKTRIAIHSQKEDILTGALFQDICWAQFCGNVLVGLESVKSE